MELLNETAWHGDADGSTLMIDQDRGLFNAIGGVRGSVWSLATPSVISKVLHARSAGHSGNMEGDGFTMGGLLLVSKDGVAYEHLETDFGERANPDDVIKAAQELVKSLK